MKQLGCCIDRRYGKGCTKETCMNLPEGKTCGDCKFLWWCSKTLGREPESTTCDYFPRRFLKEDKKCKPRRKPRRRSRTTVTLVNSERKTERG